VTANAKVTLLDYGVGNVASVRRAFARLGADVDLTSDPERVAAASRVVLPGVGAFAPAKERLAASGLEEALRSALASGARLIGLCLGFQLLFEESAEFGSTTGLGLLAGRVAPFAGGVRVPHVGWNGLALERKTDIFEGVAPGSAVYFVHSSRPEGEDASDVAARCDYGGGFTAAVQKGNVWGCQFHPEKSSEVGRRILSNFLESPS
jgi:glutamine amidotransferase